MHFRVKVNSQIGWCVKKVSSKCSLKCYEKGLNIFWQSHQSPFARSLINSHYYNVAVQVIVCCFLYPFVLLPMLHLVYISSAPFVNTAHYLRDFRVRTFSPKRSRFFPNHFISHIAHVLMLGKVVFQTFSWLCCVFTMCDVFLRNFFQCQRMLQTMFLNRFQPHF